MNLSGVAYRVLLKPRVTEKAYTLGANGKYVFQVASVATKLSVKRAVEEVYGVTVSAVNIITLPGKTKVFGKGQVSGRRKPVKKAYVTLEQGQTIELFKAGL
ncbi:MAG: 50S ribosomal protein L23 [Patescibacteria group bacterium]